MKSYTGCFVSLILLLIVIFYSTVKLTQLVEFKDPSIMVSTREAYFDTDYKFEDVGNQVAFAITAYDSERNPIVQPEYG